ncbi:MAG TPA: metal-dependent hydrolase [Enhygromyxa sp.]|nr:metal-dependent hydrolase [Enhygromyxa sp.]
MDPLSQGVLGAAAAQDVIGDRLGRKTWWLGALGGMAPDLDVIIRSASDPLLALEYHRHFTHSLAFIPIGGLLVAAPFLWLARDQPREHKSRSQRVGPKGPSEARVSERAQAKPSTIRVRLDGVKPLIIAATTLGWATHGLLDAFTSYGTMLWWPFSRARVAWHWISVIDPIYTLILAVAVVLAVRQSAQGNSRTPARVGLLISSLYLGLCGFQHHRALAAQAKIAELHHHEIVRGEAQPLFLTNLLWRSMYETRDGRIWIDALAIPWWSKIEHHGGGARMKVAAPTEADDPRARDLARFAWFASGWIYAAPELMPEGSSDPIYCDARYSLAPGGFDPMFCVELGADGATRLIQRRPDDAGAVFGQLFEMLR